MWSDGNESSAVNSQCGNQNINIHYSQILTKRYRSFAAVFRRGSISGFIPLSVSQSKFNTLDLKCIYDMMQFKFYIVLYNYLNLNFFPNLFYILYEGEIPNFRQNFHSWTFPRGLCNFDTTPQVTIFNQTWSITGEAVEVSTSWGLKKVKGAFFHVWLTFGLVILGKKIK